MVKLRDLLPLKSKVSHPAETVVSTLSDVEQLDVVKDAHRKRGDSSKSRPPGPLFLRAGKERFGGDVVAVGAMAAHPTLRVAFIVEVDPNVAEKVDRGFE